MQIDNQLISYLEQLSYFKLSDKEKDILTADLQDIINGIAKIKELDTDGVNERVHSFDNVNVFRDDVILPSFDRELILKNAPVKNDEFFITPKTVE
ncbi:MAG: Asp-tRNA(Asn)/Glu-tRNA(Gln) amidotransferase subunit GatC [Treponema sp.]|nr:Asp-tRNA(Asn)/Glu-tRNA(Gln) amidotransferase subunit GatC [Treponema sp.]